jgi:hypothetical protein
MDPFLTKVGQAYRECNGVTLANLLDPIPSPFVSGPLVQDLSHLDGSSHNNMNMNMNGFGRNTSNNNNGKRIIDALVMQKIPSQYQNFIHAFISFIPSSNDTENAYQLLSSTIKYVNQLCSTHLRTYISSSIVHIYMDGYHYKNSLNVPVSLALEQCICSFFSV